MAFFCVGASTPQPKRNSYPVMSRTPHFWNFFAEQHGPSLALVLFLKQNGSVNLPLQERVTSVNRPDIFALLVPFNAALRTFTNSILTAIILFVPEDSYNSYAHLQQLTPRFDLLPR